MGLLSRHGSSASSRRPPPTPQNQTSSQQQTSTQGHQPAVDHTRPERQWVGWRFVRSGTSTPKSSLEPVDNAAVENAWQADSRAPAIPARTSSKEAAGNDNLARSLARKGLSLKTSASKLSLVSNLSSNSIWSTSSKRPEKSPRSPVGQDSLPFSHSASSSISGPTRFQHLTHAVPEQFTRIAAATQSDLVADFSAMRASQSAGREFRGIKTVDLHSRNSSAETNTSSIVSVEGGSSSAAISLASESSYNSMSSVDKPLPTSPPEIRARRSPESFSQPFSNRNSSRLSVVSHVTPPPRISSRKAVTRSEESSGTEDSGRSSRDLPLILADVGNFAERPNSIAGYPLESPPAYSCSTEHNNAVNTDNWNYGEPLSCVTEEAAPRSVSPPAYLPNQQTARENQARWPRSHAPPPRSSSQDSNITITPLESGKNIAEKSKASIPQDDSSQVSTTKESSKKHRSIMRSSLNNGLFTSWSFDEEPPTPPQKDSRSRRHKASSKSVSRLPQPQTLTKQDHVLSSTPGSDRRKSHENQVSKSRLPTRSDVPSSKQNHHGHRASSSGGQGFEHRSRRASRVEQAF